MPRLEKLQNLPEKVDGSTIQNFKGVLGLKNDFININDVKVELGKTVEIPSIVSIKDYGAVGDGVTNDTLAIQTAEAASSRIFVPTGNYLISETIDYSKFYGDGNFKIGSETFPAGNIVSSTTITVPTTFGYKEIFSNYLPYRRILAPLKISIPAGTHNVDMTATNQGAGVNIQYEHPDGQMISIEGAASSSTNLVFDFTGQAAQRMYAIGLDGNYNIKLIDKITFNGNNYSGHTNGSPTSGAGNGSDPIGCKVQNGGALQFGTDVVFKFFARNGVFSNEGAYILANEVDVNNCGSDAFVASIGAALFAEDSTSSVIYGDAYFANRNGVIYCKGGTANDIRKRADNTAGEGILANEGGVIYAEDVTLTNIADVGIFIASNGNVVGDDITVGGNGVGCGSYGVHLINGNFSGSRLDVSHSGSDGILLENCSSLSSNGCISSNNSGDGLSVTEASTATVTSGTFNSNSSDGISVSASYVHATSLASVDSNGAFGIISRRAGVVNADNATIGSGNTSGATSPSGNTTDGTSQSVIYT